MAEQRIGLTDAIRALRMELEESILASQGEQLRFEVGEIELEFQVVIERSATANGGIKFWVVELGGEGGYSRSETHSVKVPLKPVGATGEPVLTGPRGGVVPD